MRLHALAAGIALLGMPGPSAAITFSLATKPGDTLTAAQSAAFTAAANAWSAVFADNITINLQIGFAALADSVLGQTDPVFLTDTAATIDALLAADAKDANDTAAVASLSTQTATIVSVTRAQAKALGWAALTPGTIDATIEFSTNYNFSTQRNPDGTTPAATYDLIGIAEHEIGHVLGFASQIDGGPAGQTLLDQFRFGAPGTRSVTAGLPAYFSIDNGATNIANFAIGGPGNYQASHWLQGTASLMDPAVAPGVSKNITPLDIAALDVIGFDIPTTPVAVPEPGAAALILVGLTALAWSRLRDFSASSSRLRDFSASSSRLRDFSASWSRLRDFSVSSSRGRDPSASGSRPPLRIRLRRRPNTPSPHRRRRGHAEHR